VLRLITPCALCPVQGLSWYRSLGQGCRRLLFGNETYKGPPTDCPMLNARETGHERGEEPDPPRPPNGLVATQSLHGARLSCGAFRAQNLVCLGERGDGTGVPGSLAPTLTLTHHSRLLPWCLLSCRTGVTPTDTLEMITMTCWSL